MRRGPRFYLMLAGPVVVLIGGLYFYLTSGRYESTDDAYVEAAQTSISTNIPGRVVELDVHDNQRVQRGAVLFRLDPRRYDIAVAAAEASRAAARTQVEALKATYQQKLSELQSARDSLQFAQQEYARQKRLLAPGIASRAQFEHAQDALNSARQKVAALKQAAAGVLASLGGKADIQPDQHPLVQQAQAALDHAKLNLSYTVVTAPIDGVVTKVEQLQVGDYVIAGSPQFVLVSSHDIWIRANFKEVQLTRMQSGQTATVNIDAYPHHTFKAHVASFSPGTGSQFSALPPENATGNWVKVVQRLAVRLQLDQPDLHFPLYSGLSADVEVDTQSAHDSTRDGQKGRD